MSEKTQKTPYPLRMDDDLKAWVQQRAKQNDRSLNAELNRILRQQKDLETRHIQAIEEETNP